MCTVKLMVDENLGFHINISVEEVSEFCFGLNGAVCKYFVQQNVQFLSNYGKILSFVGTCLLITRTSSSASSVLLNKEPSSFFNPKLIERNMSYDDHVKSWRTIASNSLPKISTSNLDLNLHP